MILNYVKVETKLNFTSFIGRTFLGVTQGW